MEKEESERTSGKKHWHVRAVKFRFQVLQQQRKIENIPITGQRRGWIRATIQAGNERRSCAHDGRLGQGLVKRSIRAQWLLQQRIQEACMACFNRQDRASRRKNPFVFDRRLQPLSRHPLRCFPAFEKVRQTRPDLSG